MPPEDVLREGPKRALVLALHELYAAAGYPTLRTMEKGIRDDKEVTGTLSYDTIHGVLRGQRVPRWDNFQALVHYLAAAQVDRRKDVEGAKERLHQLWLPAFTPSEDLQLSGDPLPLQNREEESEGTEEHGAELHSDPDLRAAHRWYTQQIEAGDTEALVQLGTLLECRLNPPSIEAARRLYLRAAEAGSLDAMNRLADLVTRKVEPPEPTDAALWYERAADAGSLAAMIKLADLLENGLPPVDTAAAEIWLEKAAKAGNTEAMRLLGEHIHKYDPARKDEARQWSEQAALAGSPAAMRSFGLLLRHQTPPDYPGSRWWLERSAAAGDSVGMIQLALILDPGAERNLYDRFKGWNEPEDSDGSRAWLELAAGAGNSDAMLLLARRLLRRRPIGRRHIGAATMWLQMAATNGRHDAMFELAHLLEVQGDAFEAKRWYDEYFASTNRSWDREELTKFLGRNPQIHGARESLQAAAEDGDALAMRELSVHLKWRSPRDEAEALKWHHTALRTGPPGLVYWLRWWGWFEPRAPR
ncbi:hypothetical protein BWI15_30975 [Kribbella sp. ALI-6-A]|nr:hypothetical protein BWI15_30975 [Kribbella sp. ALI-6-A]